jgi:hypothetical protein
MPQKSIPIVVAFSIAAAKIPQSFSIPVSAMRQKRFAMRQFQNKRRTLPAFACFCRRKGLLLLLL